MGLKEYKRKRRFDVTPEPSGEEKRPAPKRRKALRYVIQKHRATALHYDFRLEWKGVLLSWAVPKGPSLDPSVKRMAMPTEDHPLAYAAFEGIIPEGEYGGGTVMIWDEGTWTPESEDVDAALKRGDLKFSLKGKSSKAPGSSSGCARAPGKAGRGGSSSSIATTTRARKTSRRPSPVRSSRTES